MYVGKKKLNPTYFQSVFSFIYNLIINFKSI